MSKQSRIRHAARKKKEKKKRRAMSTTDRLPDSPGLISRMSQHHLDVLQNIEAIVVQSWREDPSIDDGVAYRALRAAMNGQPSDDESSRAIADGLMEVRRLRADVPDRVWRDALLTVAQSVRRHSACRAGETAYLRFAAPYLP